MTCCEFLCLVPTYDPMEALAQRVNASNTETVFVTGDLVKAAIT